MWFNIRFGTRHWQWGPNGMTFEVNPAQVYYRYIHQQSWKWFEVHCIFGIHL